MRTSDNSLLVAVSQKDLCLLPRMANRHGLITGATGTGKTVTLQSLAEGFSECGVPCFLADVKGDLSGLAKSGSPEGRLAQRIADLGLTAKGYHNTSFPVCFWDVFGEQGHPLRATISDMGPLLLSRLLNLNSVQQSLMHMLFRIADDHGLLLLDLKDLRSMLQHMHDARANYQARYGTISSASIGAIQRSILQLESQGGDIFFGEPSLSIQDILRTDAWGNGVINVLSADRLINSSPLIYSSLLLWLLSELFEKLPECGDLEKPKLVFFFDEAHLLFTSAEPVLVQKIEQVVRLIRSRGVGIYFVSQSPSDMPDSILAQLGNRVQHALRAYTPKERKALKSAALAFRPNPAFATEDAIEALGVGEALVSFLDDQGIPGIVERAHIVPPESQIGPISREERAYIIENSTLAGVYDTAVDRYSAYEMLLNAHEQQEPSRPSKRESAKKQQESPSVFDELLSGFAKQAGRTLTRKLSNELVRGVLGTIFGSKR